MSSSNKPSIKNWLQNPGRLASIGPLLLLLTGFLGPLILVITYSFMPEKTFSLLQRPTLENYTSIFSDSFYISFLWSASLAFVAVIILFIVCYPVAYGLAKVFGKWANLITALIAVPILISENIRLFGWVMFYVKNGVLDGTFKYLFGISISGFLYTPPAILFGLIYVYLPFMLFPLVMGISMVPETLKEAASDMGANRLQVFKEVELPLSMPGIMIGGILCFILTLGSLIEAKILGGQSVIMIADDIESAFTFAQNWPKGAALSVLLIAFSGFVVFMLFKRVDLDTLVGKK